MERDEVAVLMAVGILASGLLKDKYNPYGWNPKETMGIAFKFADAFIEKSKEVLPSAK